MNSIYINQNLPQNLRIVCAFRQSYYKAKRLLQAQIFITTIFTVCFSVIKLLLSFTEIDIAVYAVLYSVFVFVIDFFVLQPLISKKRTDGAKLQEDFDCSVFELPWDKICAGKKVDQEAIDLLSNEFIKRQAGDISNCKDWYPDEYQVLELKSAILACQKTSLVYDIKLRNRYNALIVRNTLFLSILVFVCSLAEEITLQSFLLYVVLPLLPVITLSKKMFNEHRKSIKASAELKNLISEIEGKPDEITISNLRSIQTKIFNNRKDSALIPEKIYNKLRDKLEKEMHMHASSKVNSDISK